MSVERLRERRQAPIQYAQVSVARSGARPGLGSSMSLLTPLQGSAMANDIKASKVSHKLPSRALGTHRSRT